MFGSSMKKDAIVNIFNGSNMFTICAVSNSLCPEVDIMSEMCVGTVDTFGPHRS